MSVEALVVRDGLGAGLNKKQLAFTKAANDPAVGHVGIGGSFGAGKTQAGIRQIVAWAWQFPADYLVVRETYRRLEDSTKKAMMKGDGGLAPALHPNLYDERDYRVVDNEVRLKSGGVIKFRSAENPKETVDLVKNLTLGGYLIDQVEELSDPAYEELYDVLQGRLRHPGAPNKGLSISNPDAETHWYYKRVVDEATRDHEAVYIPVTLYDNIENLDKNYVRRMLGFEHTNKEYFDRYVLGKWGVFGGKRFKSFNPAIHVVDPFPIPREWEVIEGMDYGWAHLFVCEWMAIDPYGRRYMVSEHAKSEMRISEHAAAIKERRADLNLDPSSIWLDPAAWTSRGEFASPAMELQEHGILVARAQHDRLGGWNHLDELLSTIVEDPDNPEDRSKAQPGLVLFRGRCPVLEKQIASARIKEGTDDVEKTNDDALDACRYILNARPPVPPPPPKDRHEELIERKLERIRERQEERLYGA